MPKISDDQDSHINNGGDATGISDLNVLKSVYLKTHKYNTSSSSLKDLYEFFRDTIGTRGNANDEKPVSGYGTNSISLGSFDDNYIYGFNIKATSEGRKDRYYDANNGSCTIIPKYGKANTVFRVEFGAEVSTGAVGQSITFPDLNGTEREQPATPGVWKYDQGPGNPWKDYSVVISHEGSNASTRGDDAIGFTVRIGYADGACLIKRSAQDLEENIRVSARNYIVGTRLYNEDAVFDPKNKPNQVIGLVGQATSDSEIQLDWEPAAGAQTYKVYRNNVLIAQNLTSSSYLDNSGLTANTSYNYKVSAVNDNGEGTASVVVAVKTPPLTTQFYFKTREDFVEKGDNITINNFLDQFGVKTQQAFIFKKYNTNYNYEFYVRLNIYDDPAISGTPADAEKTNYKTLYGLYDVNNALPTAETDYITYKNFKETAQPDLIDSYDLLSVAVYNRNANGANGTLVGQWKIAKRISEATNDEMAEGKTGLLFRDVPSGELPSGLPAQSVIPTINGFDYYSNPANPVNNNNVDKEQTLSFTVPFNISDARQTPIYTDTLDFTVTQQSGDVWKVYLDGDQSKSYTIEFSYSSDRSNNVLVQDKNPAVLNGGIIYNSGNSGRQRFNIEKITLKNGATDLRSWHIGKSFYNGNDINQTTVSKLTVTDLSDTTGTLNTLTYTHNRTDSTVGDNITTFKFKIDIS
jgi:hypothetical protein